MKEKDAPLGGERDDSKNRMPNDASSDASNIFLGGAGRSIITVFPTIPHQIYLI